MDVVDVLEVSISMVLFSLHICENLSYIYACLYMYVVSYLGYSGIREYIQNQ